MRLEINHHLLDLTCPSCSHVFGETVGKLKSNPTLPCPRCDLPMSIDAEGLRSAIADIEKRLMDLRKTLTIRIDV